ncbi:MAG: hypothetical protein WCQ26_11975 [Pseudanabaena sp. ELA748]
MVQRSLVWRSYQILTIGRQFQLMRSLEEVAASRDMSIDALLKFYKVCYNRAAW